MTPVRLSETRVPRTEKAVRPMKSPEADFGGKIEIPARPSPNGPSSGPLASPPPAKTTAPGSMMRRALGRAMEDERQMERMMKKALKGRVRTVQDLLNLQVTVYRYARQVEVMSKVVDRATQAIKQTLQTPM